MAKSDVKPQSSMSGVVNAAPEPEKPTPAGYIRMFTHSGSERLVPEAEYEQAKSDGLIDVRYDVDDAYAETLAAWDAARDVFVKFHEGMKALGYVGPEDASVANIAMWTARDCFNHYVTAISALVPEEAHIAQAAEVLADGRELPPAHQHLAEAARAYPAKKLKAFQDRNRADDAAQAAEAGKE